MPLVSALDILIKTPEMGGLEGILGTVRDRVREGTSLAQALSESRADLSRFETATIGVAESCTGGLISHLLTNVAGSSDYFLFSGVTYSNDAKQNVLGVSEETLKTYGAVSEETVREMAIGVRRISGSTYGLATSGIAGPTGGTEDKPLGTVCIGISTKEETVAYTFKSPFKERLSNKQIFAICALDLFRKKIM